MNLDGKALCQNTAGRFSHYWNANRQSKIRDLFLPDENAVFQMPDEGICLKGIREIAAWLEQKEKEASRFFVCRSVHLLHSHLSRINEDGTLRAQWVTSSYDITGSNREHDKDPYQWQYYFTRLDADMVEIEGQWLFQKLVWYGLESLLPETYQPGLDPGLYTNGTEPQLPPEPAGFTHAADYIAIRNLTAGFTLRNRKGLLEDYAAETDEISLTIPYLFEGTAKGRAEVEKKIRALDDYEKENRYYLSVPAQYSPVVEVAEDGENATGFWMLQVYDLLGPGRGCHGSALPVVYRICRFKNTYRKEQGVWKFQDICVEHLFTPTVRSCDIQHSRGLINRDEMHRWIDMEEGYNKAPDPEDVFELEDMLSSWVTYLQNGHIRPWYERYLAVDSPDLRQVFMARKPPYDEYLIARGVPGFAEFARLTDSGAAKQLKNHGIHATSTPMIEVSPDGQHAAVYSTEIGFTMYAGLEGVIPEEPFEGRPAVALYNHRAEKGKDGKWRLVSFMWIPLYQYPSFWFTKEATRGWAGTASKRCWPGPLEEYHYCNDPDDPVDEIHEPMGNAAFFEELLGK